MATSGTNVYVVWLSNLTGHLEILFRASSDNGQTFVDKVNLSNTPNVDSIDPQIAASGNDVYISWWEDYGNGTRVPFFKASNDNGRTFESVLSLSDNGPIPVQENNINSATD
jgi:tricorn protease-like protein